MSHLHQIQSAAVRRIVALRPPHVIDACAPAEVMRRVYGIEPDQWRCPECATVASATHYPANTCRGCGRPYPRRCAGLPREDGRASKGCGELVEPVRYEMGRSVVWDEPWPACPACVADTARVARARRFADIVPQDENGLADRAVKDYSALPSRKAFDAVARRFIEAAGVSAALGAVAPPSERTVSTLHITGPPGVGKSTGVARIAHRLYVVRDAVRLFVWTREREIIDANADQYSRDETKAGWARALLERVRNADLLVIDELWVRTLSDSAASAMTDLWHHRLGGSALTIGISNSLPQFSTLGMHIESRFRARGELVLVGVER